MDSESRSKLIRATGLYIFIAGLLGWVSLGTPYTVGDFGTFLPYMPESLIDVGIGVVLLPILGGITFFYLATLSSLFFEGKLNQVLVSVLYAGSFIGIVGFFMVLQPISEPTVLAGYLLFGAYAVFFAYNLLSTLSTLRDQHYIRAISGAVSIFIFGQISMQMVNLYMITPGVPVSDQVLLIKDMLNWGFLAASGITLIGIFRDSRNAYLSQLGDIASSYMFVVSMSLIGTLYLNFIGGRLAQVNPVIVQLSPYVEWTGVVIVGALIFTIMRRGMRESMMVPAEIGPWAKHIQDLSATKGKKLEDFTEIISEFVSGGRKERLLIKLFKFLEENRASENEITDTLTELINHEDEKPPGFSRRGTSDRIEKRNQDARMELLGRTVNSINNLGLSGFLKENGHSDGNQVNVIEGMEN
ncbi:MAG: hypothetical protein NWE89_01010 [Candidatus Bathyarchaeota archaeon]|nr:hypothetical protein [Candidatus Bathyarchaeota archaeon]